MPQILSLKRLSYSTLSTSCLLSLYLKKGRGIKGTPGWAGVGGTAAHALIESYDRDTYAVPDAAGWREMAEEVLYYAIEAETVRSGVEPDKWRVSGQATKAWPAKEDFSWWTHHLPIFGQLYQTWRLSHPELEIWTTPEGERAIELEISVPVPGVDIPYLGYIDRIFKDTSRAGALVVWDAKFGRRPVQDLEQLTAYAALTEMKYGIRPQYGAIYNGRKGELAVVGGERAEMAPLGHIPTSMFVQQTAERKKILDLGVYPASPGQHCSWCDARSACATAKGKDAWLHDPHHPAYRDDVALAA